MECQGRNRSKERLGNEQIAALTHLTQRKRVRSRKGCANCDGAYQIGIVPFYQMEENLGVVSGEDCAASHGAAVLGLTLLPLIEIFCRTIAADFRRIPNQHCKEPHRKGSEPCVRAARFSPTITQQAD